MIGITAAEMAAVLDRLDERAELAPQLTRDALIELAATAPMIEADPLYGRACALMGRVALATGDYALAVEPLTAAWQAFTAAGDEVAAARA
ncbi:MAG: hypothetical protein KC620_18820, partial [Myxococcales bacterium]|nr:hypothetical protein [Myxococcales bacterium]